LRADFRSPLMAAISKEGIAMAYDDIDRLIDSASGVGDAGAKAPAMKRSDRTVAKRAPLGFGTFSLAAAASVTLTATVQRPFMADRLLVVPSQVGLLISSIKIGDEEQVLGGNVPAELYGINAIADNKSDDFTPCPAGIQLALTLTNSAATTTTGAAGMKGYVKR
jgi:hypothetical protein